MAANGSVHANPASGAAPETSYQRLSASDPEPLSSTSPASSPVLVPAYIPSPSHDPDRDLEPAEASPPLPLPPSVKKTSASRPADGVFSNLSAKPLRSTATSAASGFPGNVGPAVDSPCLPPSYETALEDPSPPRYLENTFFASDSAAAAGANGAANYMSVDAEVLVEGLPVGSTFAFFITLIASVSFQLVGFVFTYILSWSHAGHHGSCAGLGLTIMQAALFLHSTATSMQYTYSYDESGKIDDELPHDISGRQDILQTQRLTAAGQDPQPFRSSLHVLLATEFLSYVLLVGGWLLLVRSCAKFLRIKRLESIILANPEACNA